jgi:hypothetical protein
MSSPPILGTATDFDQLIAPCQVPTKILSGQEPALQVADQLHRGIDIVGRFERSGLAGFKVGAEGRRLRVKVVLAVDAGSVRGWNLDGEPGAVEAGNGLPRLVQVRSQGRLRQCVLLRTSGQTKWGVAVFDLPPEEIPDDGLICVEALDLMEGRDISGALREAVAGSVLDDGVAGLRIDSVAFTESPAEGRTTAAAERTADGARCEKLSLISCGGLADLGRRGPRALRSGLLVVNPVPPGVFACGGRLTLRLGSRAARTQKRRIRPGRNGAAAAPTVRQVLNFQDGDLVPPIQATSGGITELELAAPANGPVLVAVTAKKGAVPILDSATWAPAPDSVTERRLR